MSELIVSSLEKNISSSLDHFESELASIRANRAHPSLVENISVEAYESQMPLVQLASISVPAPDMIIVQPWDEAVVKSIEQALNQASLGVSVSIDGNVIRVIMPPLSKDRRKELAKLVRTKGEEAQVSLRNVRHAAVDEVGRDESLSDDDKFRIKKQIQERVDAAGKKVKEAVEKKEKDITSL